MENKDLLIALVTRLMAGSYHSDDELDEEMAEFAAAVPHPRASDLIYFWEEEFDHEPTPEEVVDRALTYSSIEL